MSKQHEQMMDRAARQAMFGDASYESPEEQEAREIEAHAAYSNLMSDVWYVIGQMHWAAEAAMQAIGALVEEGTVEEIIGQDRFDTLIAGGYIKGHVIA